MKRWVAVTAYPNRPSPYFSELECCCTGSSNLAIEFASDIWALRGSPGVLNLHRLKRLYRSADGRRSTRAAIRLLRRLRALQWDGWQVVWTFHNLYPIDVERHNTADRIAAWGVAALADFIVTHTKADARWWRSQLPGKAITVGGWGGMPTAVGSPPEDIAKLVAAMRTEPFPCLAFGNAAPYKALVDVARVFTDAAPKGHSLFVIGPASPSLVATLATLAPRVNTYPVWVSHEAASYVYAAARLALCHYRCDGPYGFLRQTIFPSSVATAAAFGVPIVAPRLPAIEEIASEVPTILYSADGFGEALARSDSLPDTRGARHIEGNGGWAQIKATYEAIAQGQIPLA